MLYVAKLRFHIFCTIFQLTFTFQFYSSERKQNSPSKEFDKWKRERKRVKDRKYKEHVR